MNLDEHHKQQVAKWLNEGLKLAEVQKRLAEEFKISLTYMEVKFLVSDLNMKPKDPEPEKPAEPAPAASANAPGTPGDMGDDLGDYVDDELPAGAPGSVQVTIDQITRPGAMVSGKATFANGKTCEWVLDQMGRLGLIPSADGYKPSPADLQEFQFALEGVLRKSGF